MKKRDDFAEIGYAYGSNAELHASNGSASAGGSGGAVEDRVSGLGLSSFHRSRMLSLVH